MNHCKILLSFFLALPLLILAGNLRAADEPLPEKQAETATAPAADVDKKAEDGKAPDAEKAPEKKSDGESKENAGAEYLDQATEAKITAASMDDLARVIRLCERAKKAGLSPENTEYCDQLKASTQMQRGLITAKVLLEMDPSQPSWDMLRHTTLSDLEEALKIIPDHAQAYFSIAQLNLVPGGDRERGKAALETAIEKVGDEDLELKAKAMLFKSHLEEDKEKKLAILRDVLKIVPESVPVLLECGAVFADAEQFDEAIECMKKILELDPENAVALGMSAEIYYRQEKFEDALRIIGQLEKIRPGETALLLEKGRILYRMEKLDEAIAALEEARAKDPRNPDILALRASIYLDKKDYESAEKDIDALSRFDNPKAKNVALRLRVKLLGDQEKYDEAIEQLDKLIETSDYTVDLQLWKAMLYSSKKANSKALAILDEVLKMPKDEFRDEDYFRTLRSRGDVLLGLGDHNEAIKTYEKALELNPKDYNLLNNLAWVLATSPFETYRNGRRALELATESAELCEYQKAHVLSTLASAYAELGDFDKAIEWSAKAVELAEKEEHEKIDELKKELESYKEHKPWRERTEEDVKDEEKK